MVVIMADITVDIIVKSSFAIFFSYVSPKNLRHLSEVFLDLFFICFKITGIFIFIIFNTKFSKHIVINVFTLCYDLLKKSALLLIKYIVKSPISLGFSVRCDGTQIKHFFFHCLNIDFCEFFSRKYLFAVFDLSKNEIEILTYRYFYFNNSCGTAWHQDFFLGQ